MFGLKDTGAKIHIKIEAMFIISSDQWVLVPKRVRVAGPYFPIFTVGVWMRLTS